MDFAHTVNLAAHIGAGGIGTLIGLPILVHDKGTVPQIAPSVIGTALIIYFFVQNARARPRPMQ
ncbi:MAG: hypothetical protein SGI99_17855 [Pseudomonadota bacterium]|nr:hypothetical protein [Pseudomonadota bacterium]